MPCPGLWARAARRPTPPAPGEALSAPARCLLPKEGVRQTPLNRSPARTGAHALHDAAPVVTIFYCVTCNYLPQATEAADALREALGIEAVLVRGHSGRFEVEVDGKLVLAKGKGCFPTSRDVVEAVARVLGRLQSISH